MNIDIVMAIFIAILPSLVQFSSNFISENNKMYGKSLRKSYKIKLVDYRYIILKSLPILCLLILLIKFVIKKPSVFWGFYGMSLIIHEFYSDYLMIKAEKIEINSNSIIRKFQDKIFAKYDSLEKSSSVIQWLIGSVYSTLLYGFAYTVFKDLSEISIEPVLSLVVLYVGFALVVFKMYKKDIDYIVRRFASPNYFKVILYEADECIQCSDVKENKRYYILDIDLNDGLSMNEIMKKYISEHHSRKKHIVLLNKNAVKAISYSINEEY